MTKLIKIDQKTPIPMIGLLFVGVIDRGSNLIQIRSHTYCNMKCIFCSTSANGEIHTNNFEVDLNWLLNGIKEMIHLKQCNNIEANLDSVGEPSAYPSLLDLIKELKTIKEIKTISIQSNGTLLTKEKINKLEKAGLNRINFSIHATSDLAKELMGVPHYNLENILNILNHISKSKIELVLTPVYLPGKNDEEIPKLIELSKKLNCKIAIQKYEKYKYSRKPKGIKKINWYKFYRYLEQLEKEHNIKLKIGPIDLKIHRTKKIPLIFKKGDTLNVKILSQGWYPNQVIASNKNRAITILNCDKKAGDIIKVKIIDTANSIYIAKKA